MVKNTPASAGDTETWVHPWVGKLPWRRKWQPTAVFLPGESHGQRSLAGYSLWGCKELDRMECTHTHTHTHSHNGFAKLCSFLSCNEVNQL